MMNAMAVEMVIRTLNSILSDENKPIGRSVSNGFTERPGFVSVVRIPPNFSALVLDFWRFERVTDAMHGTNGLRTELMAQCLDVRIDGASAGSIHPIPHFLEQFLASEHGLRLAGQRGQQIEFRRGQVHLLAIDGDDTLRGIDDQGAEIEKLLVFGVFGDDLGTIYTAQQRLATGR